jgi:PD-(D/E)XK nuclease superfamily
LIAQVPQRRVDNLFAVLQHKKGERYLTYLLGHLLRRDALQQVVRERVLDTPSGETADRLDTHLSVSEERVAEDGGIPDLRMQNERMIAFLEVKVWADFTQRQLQGYWTTLRTEGQNRRQLYFVLAPAHRHRELSAQLESSARQLGIADIKWRIVTWEALAEALGEVEQQSSVSEVDRYLASAAVDFIRQEVTGLQALTDAEIVALDDEAAHGGATQRDVPVLRLLGLLDKTRDVAGVGKLYFSANPLGPGLWVSFTVNPGWRLTNSDGEEAEVAVYRAHDGRYRLTLELTERVVEELIARNVRLADRGYRDRDGWLERTLFDIASRHCTGPLSVQATELLSFIRAEIAFVSKVLGRRAHDWWLPQTSE